MTTVLTAERVAAEAAHRREVHSYGQASYRLRWVKIVCALAIGICFWFSVPYSLPLQVSPDPMQAAANEAAAYEGNISRQIAMPLIFVLSCYMLYRLPKRGRFTTSSKLLFASLGYVVLAVASAAWSTGPALSGKRIIVFLIDLFFAFALARVASMLEIALMGFTCTGVVAVISLVLDLFVQHTFAPGDPDYRFMGVMTPNFQAMNLVVCLLCGLTLAQRRPRWLPWLGPALGFFAILLFLTRARIGTFICLGMMVAVLFRMTKTLLPNQTRAIVMVIALMVVVPGSVYLLGRSGSGALTDAFMMGRKDTQNTSNLSNRAPLWAELMDSVGERPILGFGFEAFWTPERVQKVSLDQGWMVPHAHNTYLDQTLSLGVAGALLYASVLLGGCISAWRRYLRHRSESNLLPAQLLTWLALLSMTESMPLSPYLPTMIAYSCLVKLCMREGSEADADTALGPGEILGPLPPAGSWAGKMHMRPQGEIAV